MVHWTNLLYQLLQLTGSCIFPGAIVQTHIKSCQLHACQWYTSHHVSVTDKTKIDWHLMQNYSSNDTMFTSVLTLYQSLVVPASCAAHVYRRSRIIYNFLILIGTIKLSGYINIIGWWPSFLAFTRNTYIYSLEIKKIENWKIIKDFTCFKDFCE